MATENFLYLTYTEAVGHHFDLMLAYGEIRFGVDSRSMIDSALARPKHAAFYENADVVR